MRHGYARRVPAMRQLLAVALFCVASTIASAPPDLLKTYSPADSRCSFATVDGKKPVTSTYHRGEGDAEGKGKIFCFDQRYCRCQVRFIDLPKVAQDLPEPEITKRYAYQPWI